MLLAIDVGNTHTVAGLFSGETLEHSWRLTSSATYTTDELVLLYRQVLESAGREPAAVTGLAVCSVVPALTAEYRELGRRLFGCDTLVIDHVAVPGLRILNHDPASVGADRLVNAAAAYAAYGGPLIIVDFGTATTFCVVTKDGAYRGGVIAPGVEISADALTSRAAKLSKVEWVRPDTTIGRDTASSMQTGIIQGHACLVDGIVRLIQKELGVRCRVVATGGLTSLIEPASECIDTVRPHLTLEGLVLIAERLRRLGRHRSALSTGRRPRPRTVAGRPKRSRGFRPKP